MDSVAEGEWVAGLGLAAKGLAVTDAADDERFAGRIPSERYRSDSFVIAPLQTTSGVLGVLCATDRSSGEPFGADDLLLLRLLAQHVAPLIEDGLAITPLTKYPAMPHIISYFSQFHLDF